MCFLMFRGCFEQLKYTNAAVHFGLPSVVPPTQKFENHCHWVAPSSWAQWQLTPTNEKVKRKKERKSNYLAQSRQRFLLPLHWIIPLNYKYSLKFASAKDACYTNQLRSGFNLTTIIRTNRMTARRNQQWLRWLQALGVRKSFCY